ncbi:MULTISPECIES: hypothetical protein [Nitrosomonas]|nr:MULTISPECIES: hypothetical protein [Nitrosomonas]UVS62070.1 hypothetical protein NX761_02760 [Nitrosomonas sp. PLL12]
MIPQNNDGGSASVLLERTHFDRANSIARLGQQLHSLTAHSQ